MSADAGNVFESTPVHAAFTVPFLWQIGKACRRLALPAPNGRFAVAEGHTAIDGDSGQSTAYRISVSWDYQSTLAAVC